MVREGQSIIYDDSVIHILLA